MSDESSTLDVDIQPLDEELNKELVREFSGERTGFVRVGAEGYLLPSGYVREAQKLYNFQPRPDDTWVITYPRSGTTLTQEMVWLIANNLDFETAKTIPQGQRFPFYEWTTFFHDEMKSELIKENASDPVKLEIVENLSKPAYKLLEKQKTPRFIKTHLPISLLPKTLLDVGCKVIYVARNPKDVAVSFYHHNRLFRSTNYRGDFSKYWDYFERNLIPWTPYWSHVIEGWKLKSHPNVLFLFFEDIAKDIRSTINKTAEFLLGHRMSQDDTDKLAEYLNIANFRHNPAVNLEILTDVGLLLKDKDRFIRQGQTGGWVDKFTPELNEKADKWISENLKNTDLRFPGF